MYMALHSRPKRAARRSGSAEAVVTALLERGYLDIGHHGRYRRFVMDGGIGCLFVGPDGQVLTGHDPATARQLGQAERSRLIAEGRQAMAVQR